MKNAHRYPVNWLSEIRPMILSRDNYRCVQCGNRAGTLIAYLKNHPIINLEGKDQSIYLMKGYKISKCVLTISHKDHDTTNNDPVNLQTLCSIHHLIYDYNQHQKTRFENKVKKAANSLRLF